MSIVFEHPQTGIIKVCPTGFSWTTLFFGFLVPLIRGWYICAAIMLLLSVFSCGIAQIIYCFFINEHYMNHLLEQGYVRIRSY